MPKLYPDSEPSTAAPVTLPSLYTDKLGLAHALYVSGRTIDNWKAAGVIPYLLIGGVIRYDLDAVRAALERKFLVTDRPATEKQLQNNYGNPKTRRGRPRKAEVKA